jgi:hypothetical protein
MQFLFILSKNTNSAQQGCTGRDDQLWHVSLVSRVGQDQKINGAYTVFLAG